MRSRDSNSPSVTIRCNGAEAVHRMVAGAQAFSEQCALEAGHGARLAIIIEELVFNLVDHGQIGEDGVIELALTYDDGVVGIALSDSGVAFDLRDAESEDAIPERGGGAGIDLVRAWAEVVNYEQDGGRNKLLLKMWLS